MFAIHNIRESRVFQEAKAEGFQIGFKIGFAIGFAIAISKMNSKKIDTKKIAAILDMDEKVVRQMIADANETWQAYCRHRPRHRDAAGQG